MTYKEFENTLIEILIRLLNCDINIYINENSNKLSISCYNMPMFRSFDIDIEIDTNKLFYYSFSELDILKVVKVIINNVL